MGGTKFAITAITVADSANPENPRTNPAPNAVMSKMTMISDENPVKFVMD
tara:strand:- start:945 stop:1094 length:150 start_codon:yes stop_codon:yes gene_type:complete